MEDPQFFSSLPVPHVEALAASLDGASDIPERYIRPEAEAEPVADDDEGVNLPVIDLGQAKLSREESAKLGLACEEWGFFQLINHGVPTELIEKIKMDLIEFFKLPIEEKEAFAQIPGHGSYDGYGHAFVKSEKQKLDWGDIIALDILPLKKKKLRFWPTYPPSFRENLEAYTSELKEVTNCILGLMAENLGLEPEVMTDNFKDMKQAIVGHYYPRCPKANKVFGLSPHSDADALTILLQANGVDGLQLRKNGVWIPVKSLPGAFIVNVGDLLEIFSNGKYKSIEHRAVVNTEKERISLATFHGPNEDSIIRPLPQLVKGGAANYTASTYEDFMKAFFAKRLDGKSHLESVKLTRN